MCKKRLMLCVPVNLLGLPTETVYGLAADASSENAVAKIFKAKGRPSNHPLIVHVASSRGRQIILSVKCLTFAERLMAQFWPGPLTLILPRREEHGRCGSGGGKIQWVCGALHTLWRWPF
jgi:L-threonylcarbamoyladenylate synthase